MSIILPAAKCSQMSSPKTGTGSGGDRCVEATLAMIDATFKLGPHAQAGYSPEQLMYEFTEAWNQGRDVSALESGRRIDLYVNDHAPYKTSSVGGQFPNVQTIIDRGNIAYTGVNDYRKLRLVGGGNPFMWNPDNEPPAGHVLLIVGYGEGVVVHDPLRGIADGQPAEYSVQSFIDAGWDVIVEITGGKRLDSPPPPTDKIIRIVGGMTMWGLAEEYYGDGELWTVIQAANPEVDPRMLHIGGTLIIPPKPEGV